MEQTTIKKGNIQVQTENIFPIIKKFLYADQDIFIRELVSNGVDAVQKIKTLAGAGQFSGDLGDLNVKVKVDKESRTIVIEDNGIGMTEDEMEKYLNQVAFSGAREFLEKYKEVSEPNTIIGNFGLGFYSAFMVSKKVTVDSLSYTEGAEPALWECDGSPEYSMQRGTRSTRGTTITLYLNEEDAETFSDENKVKEILKKYGKFLPVEVIVGEETINNTQPAWTKKPADLSDEDYKNFYKELYPTLFEEPMFHIHLNVDYPFNLTGILYFPKITERIDHSRNKISLYSNQVFITDSVENIVPEYLTLLHGVIDSPDIPLNVSRSYLQADGNVKKISSHISKKVSDKLEELFRNHREDFEKKWDDLKIFAQYGTVTDEKFGERAQKFSLFKDTTGNYSTFEELKNTCAETQTDKDGQLVLLYTPDAQLHHSEIQLCIERGYKVLVMDSPLEAHYIGYLEQHNEKTRFIRVDSAPIEKLIDKGFSAPDTLSEEEKAEIKPLFENLVKERGYMVKLEAATENEPPLMLTQPEFMRRMMEMQQLGGRKDMPEMLELVVNTNHPVMKKMLVRSEEERLTSAQHLLDLALISKGLLKGEGLSLFVQRSLASL
jgi:molecular chaperone HtpG